MKDTSNNNDYSTPSWDGRLQYFRVLENQMNILSQVKQIDDLRDRIKGWIDINDYLMNICSPFMLPSVDQKLEEELDSIKKEHFVLVRTKANNYNSDFFFVELEDRLTKFNRKLFRGIKHLLLPEQKGGVKEFDVNSFTDEFLRDL